MLFLFRRLPHPSPSRLLSLFLAASSGLLLIAGFPGTLAAQDAAPAASLLAPQVKELFQRSCAECHDAAVRKPKGGFGHVADLDRLVAEGDYIAPGQPEKSMIYTVLADPDPDVLMPPPDSDAPKLTEAEKDTVKQWILALTAPEAPAPSGPSPLEPTAPTAPTAESAATDTAPPAFSAPVEAATEPAVLPEPTTTPAPAPLAPPVAEPAPAAPQAGGPSLMKVFARTHIMVVHFPVALLLLAAAVDWLGLLLRRGTAWVPAVSWTSGVAALAAPASVLTGWLLADMEGYKDSTVFLHRWLGVATMVTALLGWGLHALAEKKQSPGLRWAARLVLGLGALLVSLTGHTGGELVYGKGYPFN